ILQSFYIRYTYPNAVIVLQCTQTIFYQFLPDGNVQRGDALQFYETLNNPNNFFLIDAQVLTFNYNAYMILFTSPKMERFNEALKWTGFNEYFMPIWDQEEIFTLWDLQYKNKKNKNDEEFILKLFGELLDKWGTINDASRNYLEASLGPIPRSVLSKWDSKAYQNKFDSLINKFDLETCMKSINSSGMPTDIVSSRLVHLDVTSNFMKVVYRFASLKVSSLITEKYQNIKRTDVRNLITSSNDPISTVFRGNLFEDYAHLELQRG
ncbi:245_t:CDS:2, partial [Cetraspora pellucida]